MTLQISSISRMDVMILTPPAASSEGKKQEQAPPPANFCNGKTVSQPADKERKTA